MGSSLRKLSILKRERFLDPLLDPFDIADNTDYHVLRKIMRPVEMNKLLPSHSLDVLHRPQCRMPHGMLSEDGLLKKFPFVIARIVMHHVRLLEDHLALLLYHLYGKHGMKKHIREHVDSKIRVLGEHFDMVRRDLGIGVGVHLAANVLDNRRYLFAVLSFFCAFKEHMLEEMRDASDAILLII